MGDGEAPTCCFRRTIDAAPLGLSRSGLPNLTPPPPLQLPNHLRYRCAAPLLRHPTSITLTKPNCS